MSCRSTADSVDAVEALRQVEGWPCAHVAVAVDRRASRRLTATCERGFRWASVTKLATAVAVLVAAEEGIVDLDEPAGPPGSTVRHLLAHASGPAVRGRRRRSRGPGRGASTRTRGFDVLGELVGARAEMPFAEYFEPVWGFPLAGSPGSGVEALARAAARRRARAARADADRARDARRGGDASSSRASTACCPGFGRQTPNDWGLGFELRDGKTPHWTGARNSPRTFGHFGRSGTFLWVDPDAGLALACLTDLDFGDWAQEAWPRLADAVLEAALSV